jgi:hypothetical protein
MVLCNFFKFAFPGLHTNGFKLTPSFAVCFNLDPSSEELCSGVTDFIDTCKYKDLELAKQEPGLFFLASAFLRHKFSEKDG